MGEPRSEWFRWEDHKPQEGRAVWLLSREDHAQQDPWGEMRLAIIPFEARGQYWYVIEPFTAAILAVPIMPFDEWAYAHPPSTYPPVRP